MSANRSKLDNCLFVVTLEGKLAGFGGSVGGNL